MEVLAMGEAADDVRCNGKGRPCSRSSRQPDIVIMCFHAPAVDEEATVSSWGRNYADSGECPLTRRLIPFRVVQQIGKGPRPEVRHGAIRADAAQLLAAAPSFNAFFHASSSIGPERS